MATVTVVTATVVTATVVITAVTEVTHQLDMDSKILRLMVNMLVMSAQTHLLADMLVLKVITDLLMMAILAVMTTLATQETIMVTTRRRTTLAITTEKDVESHWVSISDMVTPMDIVSTLLIMVITMVKLTLTKLVNP